ncbi:NAD(+) kinase [Marinibactrum halimedae]|uniref:NAD kinase n=1 Tax=Marinibactrum halimedae TaxID=1444977 RepID=A0AA37TFG5_9GAMM|nr:NAD(+) kinase [Marinibactrum halimedae]MCD9459498.1 NAD(+) kinase [Marinibactrum halimedae]GLS28152.1 NAD kinase [Marinibactrum halimedae]
MSTSSDVSSKDSLSSSTPVSPAVFKKIGLVGRLGSDRAIYTIKRLMRFLDSCGLTVVLEADTASALPGHEHGEFSAAELGSKCDLVIVVGGDGSLLGAGREVSNHGVPLLGVNRGRLGFLTDIAPDEIEQKVADVLAGHYVSEERFLLSMEVRREGEAIAGGDALNDVVVHPGKFIRMIEFELYIDDQFVYGQRSDGIIISTPTGSTAYALSAGGPIMHPKLDAIELVPLNPHTLSSRPILLNGNVEIRLVVGSHNTAYPHVTCDGQTHVVTQPGDEVFIKKKSTAMTLIHPTDHNFYETCRRKLGWASHLVE